MAKPVASWMADGGLLVKPEFSLPWGICDLVGVKFNPASEKKRLSYGQTKPVGPLARVHILSRIPEFDSGRCVSLKKLEKEFSLHVPSDVLRQEIHFLVRDRFVRSPRRGFFHKLNGWAPLHARIVAVELKLSRFSEAVNQAIANRAFATHSYIALPADLAARIVQSNQRHALIQGGIGLLAVSEHSCRKVLEGSAKDFAYNDILQAYVAERFWRTRDS